VKKESIVKIENLNVIYNAGKSNEMQALYNINLEIFPGEFIILFGPSGCGKSTLLYSIAGLQPNMSGNIYVSKKNITALKSNDLEFYHQKKIGMIFQAYYLIASISVLQNVMLPQMAVGASWRERLKKSMELLKHFGVSEQANKLPLELSGGQQQRVAICRSLVNDPDILLADEPVGNLDSKSSHDVMTLLQDLNEKQGKTVLLVTHDPALLNYAHRVIYIRDGKIIDVKTNKSVSQIVPSAIAKKTAASSVSKELELLSRTYSSLLNNQIGGLLIPFKAKQIVYDILSGMTMEEAEKIEKLVERMIVSGVEKSDYALEYLDKKEPRGSLGLNKRTAERLLSEIVFILRDVKFIQRGKTEHKIARIRKHLLNYSQHKIENNDIINVFDQAIKNRTENKIDKASFEKVLDLPVQKGGVGLDKRIASKISKRMELLMLCIYR